MPGGMLPAVLVLLAIPLAHSFSHVGCMSLVKSAGRLGMPGCSRARMGLGLQEQDNKGAAGTAKALAESALSWKGIFGASALAIVMAISPVSVSAEVLELPEGWAMSVNEDGKEFYYDMATGKSQWDPPAGTKTDDAKKAGPYSKKKGGSGQDLREIVPFQAPTVPVDRVVVQKKPSLKGGCGETDYRANSVECGEPAKNVIEDAAVKSAQTLEILPKGVEGLKSKAASAEERSRMLQEAELKALSNTELFKKLDKATKDPAKAAERKKQIDEITAKNDIGAQKAPWTADDDPVGGVNDGAKIEIKLPEFKLPEIKLPF